MGDAQQFDRDAVDRILRRASAIADIETETDVPSGLAEETLLAAAEEVGLPEEAVRRSIAIERLGAPPDKHLGDRLLGAPVVSVDDEVDGAATEVLGQLDAWLVDGHHLRRDRLRDGRAEWSKRSGASGALLRALRNATGEGRLGDTHRVVAVAQNTGSGSCVVRVSADRARDRRVRAGTGALVAAAGATSAVAAALVAGPVVLVGAPIAMVAGVVVAASGRRREASLHLELERVLESVEDGVRPVPLSTDVVRRVTRRRTLPR